jgi:hypothetical protein
MDDIVTLIKNIIIFLTNKYIIISLIVISIVSLILGLFFIPYIIINLPEDYFIREKDYKNYNNKKRIYILFKIFKNIIGFTLIGIWTIMLVAPIHCMSFIFIGFILVDFPGKSKLEKRLIKSVKIQNMFNRIRKKHNKPPLKFI